MTYNRKCPRCLCNITHRNKRKRDDAVRMNTLCRSCGAFERYEVANSNVPRVVSNGMIYYCRECPNCDREIIYKTVGRYNEADRLRQNCGICRTEVRKGRKLPPSVVDKISCALRKRVIASLPYFPRFNPKGCAAIEEYGKKHGYNFKHALNGGEYHIKELGYFVDGYDVEQNVVIEYDELYHKYQTDKDYTREQRIVKHLKCKFIRIGPLYDT